MSGYFIMLLSVVLGIIISMFMYHILFGIYTYKGPNSNYIREKIYNHDDKCYKLVPHIFLCPTKLTKPMRA